MSRPDPIDELKRLDPIDGDRLAASWDGSDAKQALFQEITTMPLDALPAAPSSPRTAPPSPPRRRRTLALAGGLAAVAVGLAVAPGLLSDGGDAAYAVRELPDGVLVVDTSYGSMDVGDGHSLAAELREHGIDVTFESWVASPSLVGQIDVYGPAWEDARPEGIWWGEDGSADVFTMRIDPARFTDSVTIRFYVAAEEGEPYTVTTSPFEPGESLDGLHCALGQPLRADVLASALERLGISATWETIAPTDDPDITQSTPSGGVPDGEVVGSLAVSSDTIAVTVLEDGVPLDRDSFGHVFDDGEPCTAERAAAWK
jgi:hypothetical protein